MSKSIRYQFTVRRLLILSTAIAIAFAIAGGFRGPMIIRMFIGVYFASLMAWFVIRWPPVRENWRTSKRLRLAAIRHERELALEVAKRKPRVTRPQPNAAESGPNADAQ